VRYSQFWWAGVSRSRGLCARSLSQLLASLLRCVRPDFAVEAWLARVLAAQRDGDWRLENLEISCLWRKKAY
jgi:hypothetical protein